MHRIRRAEAINPSAPSASSGSDAPVSDADARVQLYYVFVEQALQHGDRDAAGRFLSADFRAHESAGDCGRTEFIERIAAQRALYPAAIWTIELLTAVGTLVICHTTLAIQQASAPALEIWETAIARIVDERIAELWCIRERTMATIAETVRLQPPAQSSSQNRC